MPSDERRAAVEHAEHADHDRERAEQRRHLSGAAPARGHVAVAPVPAAVHRRREVERSFERAFEHGNGHTAQSTQSAVRSAAEPARVADARGGDDGLRRERQRDRHDDAELVEHRRDCAQQTIRAREAVRGADARDERRELEALVERGDERLGRHRTAQRHARGPRRQVDVRQREEHVARQAVAEQHLQDDAHDDDRDPEADEAAERPRPRSLRAAGGDDEPRHRDEERQQERVRRAQRGGRECERPDPPRERVERARSHEAGRRAPGRDRAPRAEPDHQHHADDHADRRAAGRVRAGWGREPAGREHDRRRGEADVAPATVVDGWPRAVVAVVGRAAVFDVDAVVEVAVATAGPVPAASGPINGVVAAGAITDGVPPECGAVVREMVGRTVVGVGGGTQIAAALAGPRGGGSVGSPGAVGLPAPTLDGTRVDAPRARAEARVRPRAAAAVPVRPVRVLGAGLLAAPGLRDAVDRTQQTRRVVPRRRCPQPGRARGEDRRAVVARTGRNAHRAHRRTTAGVDDDRDVHRVRRAGATDRAPAQRCGERARDERGCRDRARRRIMTERHDCRRGGRRRRTAGRGRAGTPRRSRSVPTKNRSAGARCRPRPRPSTPVRSGPPPRPSFPMPRRSSAWLPSSSWSPAARTGRQRGRDRARRDRQRDLGQRGSGLHGRQQVGCERAARSGLERDPTPIGGVGGAARLQREQRVDPRRVGRTVDGAQRVEHDPGRVRVGGLTRVAEEAPSPVRVANRSELGDARGGRCGRALHVQPDRGERGRVGVGPGEGVRVDRRARHRGVAAERRPRTVGALLTLEPRHAGRVRDPDRVQREQRESLAERAVERRARRTEQSARLLTREQPGNEVDVARTERRRVGAPGHRREDEVRERARIVGAGDHHDVVDVMAEIAEERGRPGSGRRPPPRAR